MLRKIGEFLILLNNSINSYLSKTRYLLRIIKIFKISLAAAFIRTISLMLAKFLPIFLPDLKLIL